MQKRLKTHFKITQNKFLIVSPSQKNFLYMYAKVNIWVPTFFEKYFYNYMHGLDFAGILKLTAMKRTAQPQNVNKRAATARMIP